MFQVFAAAGYNCRKALDLAIAEEGNHSKPYQEEGRGRSAMDGSGDGHQGGQKEKHAQYTRRERLHPLHRRVRFTVKIPAARYSI